MILQRGVSRSLCNMLNINYITWNVNVIKKNEFEDIVN